MGTFRWTPIEDLPRNWRDLISTELASLAPIWKEQSKRLGETDVLKEFNQRLRRQWAIETGIIEDIYSIDRGITHLLIEKGIEASLIPHGATDKPAEEIVAILTDQEDVLEGLFDFVAQRRPLTISYIKEIHQALTRHQFSVQAINGAGRRIEIELRRGEWKKTPNNPTRPDGDVHEYCPPEHVASEMDNLIKMHHEHIGENVPPEVEAAWLHHRFSQIHPFQDGNGRIARTLTTVIFLRAGWFPAVIDRDIRSEYIEALETADQGNLQTLVSLFSNIQKQSFLRALKISEDVLDGHEPIRQVIEAAAERLKARFDAQIEKRRKLFEKVFDISRRLEDLTAEKLNAAANELNYELVKLNSGYFSVVESSNPETDVWFKKQIVDIAKKLDYFADARTYRAWVRLKIREERQAELVISFHSLGVEFLGILAASAFLEFRDRSEEGEVTVDGPYALSRDVFQFSVNENEEMAEARYTDWLNGVLVLGLDQWRRQI